jgi:hypothetical protein
MPPFVGNDAEREALTDWLRSLAGPVSASATASVARRLQVPPAVLAHLPAESAPAASIPDRGKP